MKTISLILVIIFVCFTTFVAIPKLSSTATVQSEYRLITLWHVDNFASGKISKADWLKKVATLFEKRNKGVLINIVNLTQSQAIELLDQGKTFDLVCFSQGIGERLLPLLTPYEGRVLSTENFTEGGVVNGFQYALPYLSGGYCFFVRQSALQNAENFPQNALNLATTKKVGKNVVTLDSLHFGTQESTLTEVALALVCGKAERQNFDQYHTYVDFVRGKFVCLLSTQRDLWRLSQRIESGKLEKLYMQVAPFTDLVQYVGIASGTKFFHLAQEFACFLQTDEVQQTLTSAGLFSVVGRNDYTDEWYKEMQNQLNVAKTTSVFLSLEQISALKEASFLGKDTLLGLLA